MPVVDIYEESTRGKRASTSPVHRSGRVLGKELSALQTIMIRCINHFPPSLLNGTLLHPYREKTQIRLIVWHLRFNKSARKHIKMYKEPLMLKVQTICSFHTIMDGVFKKKLKEI